MKGDCGEPKTGADSQEDDEASDDDKKRSQVRETSPRDDVSVPLYPPAQGVGFMQLVVFVFVLFCEAQAPCCRIG